MLEIRGVTKVYGVDGQKQKVLKGVSINFRRSEFAAILGPSGSGKTTLLNIIGGLDQYSSGDLKINEISTKRYKDKDWDSYRNHRIGFVFQSYNLIPHQTILANVKLALTLSGISKREATARAKRALKDVGLAEHIHKKPAQLSGGQMQRVAIARALVNDPEILLADEPTGALDSDTSLSIMNILSEIAKTRLVIMVTHNPDLADKYATRIITLKDGQITSDSNPYDGKVETKLKPQESKNKVKRTKMSFLTALSLSLNNLLTKKGRTILVAFAGSIGIIGIALILAVSTGFQRYIDSIEEDTLTSYPLTIMRESSDVTGILLSAIAAAGDEVESGIVKENQVLSSMLSDVSTNDLKSFQTYLDNHQDDIKDDVRLIENAYSVDPLIYTIDATGSLAKLNPSNLFSSILGSSSALGSYSSLTSVYKQYALENIQNDTKILAGRLPEKYNEMVIMLTVPSQASDLLTYSLGLHDTKKLSEMVRGVLSGEVVENHEEPLTLTYDDLMRLDLRLIYNTDLYKYNAAYNIYEDLSENESYMRSLYDNAEQLKIVGIVTPRSEMLASGTGVLYLPELITHIIDKNAETEVVKKQLENPTIDIFSDTKFGEKGSYKFEFSDLVSVDSNKLAEAFGVDIDQNTIAAKTKEYILGATDEITTDATPVHDVLTNKFKSLTEGFSTDLAAKIMSGEIDPAEFETNPDLLPSLVDTYLSSQDFSDLEALYPAAVVEPLKTAYSGLVKAYMASSMTSATTIDEFLETALAKSVFDTFSTQITEALMKQAVATKMAELSGYLTNSFANAFHVDESAIVGAFKLNFTEDELSRVVSAMFNKKESTLTNNLLQLGYQAKDEPTWISIYFSSFDGKTNFMNFIDRYNDLMRSYNQEKKVIEYTDTTGLLMSSVKTIVDAVSYVLIAFVSISLVVSSIMIGIITYISVYERTKEIGILRAIGASKHNISSIFNAETFIVGLLSGLFGIGITYILIPIINALLHHFTGDIPLAAHLDVVSALVLIVLSVILTLIGGIIPARAAAKKDPVEALRSE